MPLPASEEEVFWWAKALGWGTGAIALLWKVRLWWRADSRGDKGAEAYQDSYTRIVAGQQVEITRLQTMIVDLDRQLQAANTKRFEHEGAAAVCRQQLDVAERAAERANRRTAASEEVVKLYKAQITQLEMQVRQMQLPADGDTPA